MQVKDRFLELCIKGMQKRGVYNNEIYKKRLKEEIKEIKAQNEYGYFVDLADKGNRFSKNENNLLVAYLLGLVEDIDIEKPPGYTYGEYPDLDVDYLFEVREYLKKEWAPKTFGEDNVCYVGNYTTFKIKSALIDMARIHGYDRDEILSVTKDLIEKDEDGKELNWEGFLEHNPKLKDYADKYPDVAEAARKLSNRNRGRGTHAGGLIISKSRIDELVPIVIDDEGNHVSAWPEGLASQDLQPVGLIKFDLLVITNLLQIAKACKLIQERYGLESINALPGQRNWSDTSYLEDKKALALASQGRLKGVFQFDSSGIQSLVKSAGISCFDDLVAVTALYRPGPMGAGMHESWAKRKRGIEEYAIHPVLQPILGNTYGVLCYQEQVMKVLNAVGDIPLKDCEVVRKAISKKKASIFQKYKDDFVLNGQKILGWTQEQVEDLWGQIETFAGYGFNLSHAVCYTYISSRLLWLKAHYPLEFFAAILSCIKNEDKIKDYKRDAVSFGVKVNKVDLNKSKDNFSIVDNEIYMGFSNIKGIGDEVVKRIVENQPYRDLGDFLEKFGTDAKVLKPLIGLRLFGDKPVEIYEYFDFYKKLQTKEILRQKRFEKSKEKYLSDVGGNQLLLDKGLELNKKEWIEWYNDSYPISKGELDIEYVKYKDTLIQEAEIRGAEILKAELNREQWESWYKKQIPHEMYKIVKRYVNSSIKNEEKSKEDFKDKLGEFSPTGKIDEKIQSLFEADVVEAEFEYYGFGWTHVLEKSPDFDPERTFEIFNDDTILTTSVDVHVIEKPVEKLSKKGNPYYTVMVEDSNFRSERITFWKEDYERFSDELNVWYGDERSERGNFLKMRVTKPQNGFMSFTFDSPPRQIRWKVIPNDKNQDARIIVMNREKICK